MANRKQSNKETGVEAQHKVIGLSTISTKKLPTHAAHPGTQWFPSAGLGMIIHWGISSVNGGLDISWGMVKDTNWDTDYEGRNKIVPRDYFRLAEDFNPAQYDPDRWFQAAAAAGFKYAVLTTRHCDGYSLWPSKFGNLGTKTHMGGRDLIQPYVDACRKNGLKVGFYYSPYDWYFNREYMAFDLKNMALGSSEKNTQKLVYNLDHQLSILQTPSPEHEADFRAYERGQIIELLTNYGKIDIIWIDGVPAAISADEMRELQPGIIVGRWSEGDFETPECQLPKQKPARWWEGCFIWNYHSWGYQKPDGYNPTGWMLHLLAHCRTWGGNLLINCAPTPDGTMPDSYYARMAELADWMKWAAVSIYDVEAGPFLEQSDVPVTVRGNCWYLHLLCPEDDDKGTSWFLHLVNPKYPRREYVLQAKKAVLDQITNTPKSVRLLKTGEEIDFQLNKQKLSIHLPEDKCTLLDDVVVIEW